MQKRERLQDRRSADRPANGAVIQCPDCRSGLLEFNERYRIAPPNSATMVTIPAWVCDGANCHYWYAARKRPTLAALNRHLSDVRARASRQLMKARSVTERAKRSLAKSLARNKTR